MANTLSTERNLRIFWSSKRSERDWQKGVNGKRHSKCGKQWNVNVHVDVWSSDMSSIHKLATVLMLYYVKTKEKKAWQECKQPLKEKPYCEELCTNNHKKHGSKTPNIPSSSLSSPFPQSRLVLERVVSTHTWVQPHPAVLSAFSGLSTVNNGTSPTAFSILTWQRAVTRFYSWGLYCFILSHWTLLMIAMRYGCSEAPRWLQGWGFCF